MSQRPRIVRRLRRGEREIYVIGASGSGKSSLIAVGLVPWLSRGIDGLPSFHVRSFRPGERPLEQLAAALGGDVAAPATAIGALLARHAPVAALLLVVDQLEELFAIAHDGQRRDFLAAVRAPALTRSDLRGLPHPARYRRRLCRRRARCDGRDRHQTGAAHATIKAFRNQGLLFPTRVASGPRTDELMWAR